MKRKTRKRKLNKKKVGLLFFIILLVFIFHIIDKYKEPALTSLLSNTEDNSKYPIIKQDHNSNYSGVGQEIVTNKDGYFNTFTTENNNKKVYKEYKQNGNSSWSERYYWSGSMADNGCGITALSIILSGYNKNYTPEDLREMYYPKLDGDNIPSELSNTFEISNSVFLYDSISLSNESLENHLKTNRPVLICVWNQPTENRWTTASHYMVLLAADDNHMVYVSNPNGLENSSKSSGWYNINEISPYIAKVLYIKSYI